VRFNDSNLDARIHAEKAFALGLLQGVPGLELHLESGFFDFEDWGSADGMQFMNQVLRACEKLSNEESGKSLVRLVFVYLEAKAIELDLHVTGRCMISPANAEAIDFLLFTFTDNPTGKDSTLRKLAPCMGPKIAAMCTML